MPHPELSGNGTGTPTQVQGGTLPREAPHLQFLPRNAVLDPGAEGLRAGFFGGETSGKALRSGGSGAAIGDLVVGEDTPQESLAEALDGMRDPLYFDQIDACAHQHVATVAQRQFFRACGNTSALRRRSGNSDEASVDANGLSSCTPNEWDLHLCAFCEDAPRAVRFLTGAVMACGGGLISRGLDAGRAAAIEFQFARDACDEIYSVIVTAGLQLSAQSHQMLASLCQCTREMQPLTHEDLVHVDLRIYTVPASSSLGSGVWLLSPEAA